MKKWMAVSVDVAGSLEPSLTELVKIRASQINACANCLNMHAAEARAKGETESRIYLLSAWREAPCYTDRERAALGWTEALTRLSEGHTHLAARQALEAVSQGGTGEADADDQCHQWLEQARRRLRHVDRNPGDPGDPASQASQAKGVAA